MMDVSSISTVVNNNCGAAVGGGGGGRVRSPTRKRPSSSTPGSDDADRESGKKRRKQLNPIRIATELVDDMVKVPKQIVGSNNDLDNTHSVPNCDEGEDDDCDDRHVPNFIFPFAFPPVKGPPSLWSDASLKIFNQEAYCELCKKEFCNKYFLKTHKANKHGIYVDFPVTARGAAKENGGVGGGDTERAFCELCNKRFCNKYFVRRHKAKSHGIPDDEVSHTTVTSHDDPAQVQNPAINSTKKAATERDLDNQQDSPLNLIVKDGEDESDDDECSSENIEKLQTMILRLNPSEAVKSAGAAAREPDHKESSLSDANDSSSDEPKTDLAKTEYLYGARAKPTSSYCEICNKELCNKYFMRTHMQRMHGIEIEHGTQIGGVVCNICNKELCSKYFLRVHKQNTHGIASPSSGVVSSASASTSSSGKSTRSEPRFPANLAQVCYICNKRFRSSKWLQAHFLSDHREEARSFATAAAAATSPGVPAGLGGGNVGGDDTDDGDDVLKIPKKSQSDSPEALDVISKLFWENNSASKSYNCSQCPFTTSVLAFLFVHERSHFVLPHDPSSDSSTSKSAATLQSLLMRDPCFWQRKITQQISECLDLSSGKSKYLSFEQNGS